jgi:rare lipoprotein A
MPKHCACGWRANSVSLSGKLVVQSGNGLFRVQLGPWPDAAAAQVAGVRLRESFGMAPMVVQR